ncbi:MAG: hypothetical protein ACI8T1_000517 [Verrucomicrobiales bacterium]|jgi:hypothetical protein
MITPSLVAVMGSALAWSLLVSLAAAEKNDYRFDGKGISREVLENYLDRSVTMAFYLVSEKPEGRRVYPFHADDVRFIKNIGAKFIGRAIYRWALRVD